MLSKILDPWFYPFNIICSYELAIKLKFKTWLDVLYPSTINSLWIQKLIYNEGRDSTLSVA